MNLNSARKKGRKFLNPVPTNEVGFNKFFPILNEYISNKAETIPKIPLGPFTTDPSVYKKKPASGLRITLIGHSSLLIEIDGKRILTDPVWSERASFLSFMGPKRFFEPPLPLNMLPKLDAVLLSHDHYDHLDKATIKFFAGKNIPFFTSLAVGNYLEKWGIDPNLITELDWGDSAMIAPDMILTSVPARHFSGRGIVNRNETLWAAFVIKGPEHNIFFGADSGWFDGFADVGKVYGPFDLTMLEIGAYGKYWPDIHMGPDNASNAHLALKGKLMMPIHWGTFNLSTHAWYEPIERLLQYGEEKHIDLFIPEPGKPTEAIGPLNSEWWVSSKS
ncbi:MBL fold metallo-hydrolase [Mucilaginibacter sp.]|jgi:L-ascorbate metabolism protein UlaG (beta-lactamase superfamily)|uniref:MBL fold metallo-hydrolase n=1 Tax=Mucilaginibacter sp. TaxID=1882438 RepID=UPI002B9C8D0D|nr:MBL fold metallo-hydrolase [Mucilaginibacter sp.]HTI61132.1 MBL fold metallo-hydrolase [Mucilaginibacter sp.]